MLINYIRIAWRHLGKAKFHSAINILGLSLGIGFTLLIGAYTWSETRVNKGLRNGDRQYIVQSNWKDPDMGLNMTTLGPMVKALKEQYPHLVANYYRWDGVTSNVSRGDKVFREGLQIGDSTLLHMYGFELLYGDARTALAAPFSLVLTEEKALKYFGRKEVVGESLIIESFSGTRHDFKVTGVLKMQGENSVLRLTPDNDNQMYIPALSISYFGRSLDAWDNPYMAGYVELQKGISPQALQKPMQDLLRQHALPQIAQNMQPYLAPLEDYYLSQNNGLVRRMLYTVSFIALFILIMALVNFVNISVARSATRIREIGVRKVLGGRHHQLMVQFLVESVLLVALAMIVALGIYAAASPFLSDVLGKHIPKFSDFPSSFLLVPLAAVVCIGVLAGLYPAFVLSALKATDSVKGKLGSVNANIVLRKTLIGFQICTASVVFIGALVIVQQVNLFFSKNIGYTKDYVLSAQVPRDWTPIGVQKAATVRNQFAAMPQVSKVSLCWSVPDGQGSGNVLLYPEGRDSTQAVAHETLMADEHYLDVFQIPLAAGRFFGQPADSLNLVINEAAAKATGWKTAEEAVGKRMYLPGNRPMTVIGVVKDFQFGSMRNGIKPLVITHPRFNNLYRVLSFRLQPGNVTAAIEALQKKWASLMPGAAFEYRFMDESLRLLYASEIRLKKAAQVALVLALVIVLLGISGLISLSVQKRTKEIGIRKVIGASFSGIVSLFLKDFIPVVLAGGAVSIPIAWYIMHHWLNDYANRIPLTLLPFLLAIAVITFVAALLISVQVAGISAESPVKNLRTE